MCVTQGVQPGAVWQSRGVELGGGWEGGSRGRECIYTYGWITLL